MHFIVLIPMFETRTYVALFIIIIIAHHIQIDKQTIYSFNVS